MKKNASSQPSHTSVTGNIKYVIRLHLYHVHTRVQAFVLACMRAYLCTRVCVEFLVFGCFDSICLYSTKRNGLSMNHKRDNTTTVYRSRDVIDCCLSSSTLPSVYVWQSRCCGQEREGGRRKSGRVSGINTMSSSEKRHAG